jgi:uncharacterized membrane protein YidH (DUF202 family)
MLLVFWSSVGVAVLSLLIVAGTLGRVVVSRLRHGALPDPDRLHQDRPRPAAIVGVALAVFGFAVLVAFVAAWKIGMEMF